MLEKIILLLILSFVIACENKESNPERKKDVDKITIDKENIKETSDVVTNFNSISFNITLKHIAPPYHNKDKSKIIYNLDKNNKPIKLGEIPPFETFKIIKKLEDYNYEDIDNIIKWLEISYTNKEGKVLEGKIKESNIVYQSNRIHKGTLKDTLTVKNEKEFINALESNRIIYVKADILDFNDFVIDNKSSFKFKNLKNLKIIGVGKSVLFKKIKEEQEEQLIIENCTNLVFSNFFIEGYPRDKKTFDYDQDNLSILINNSTDIFLNNIVVNANSSNAIEIKKSSNITIENSVFKEISYDAIITNDSKNINITNNRFINGEISTFFNMNNSSDIVFSNNLISNNKLYTLQFGDFDSNNEFERHNVTLNNCLFINNIFENIFLKMKRQNYVSFNNCTINNNQLKSHFFGSEYKKTEYSSSSIYFKNSTINNNIAIDSAYIVGYSDYGNNMGYDNPIKLYNSSISDNKNFISLVQYRESDYDYIDKDKKSSISNIFISDRQLTEHNSKIYKGKKYFKFKGNLSYNDEEKVTYRGKTIVDGFHFFSKHFLKPKWYCCTSKDIEELSRKHFINAYGEIKDGYFEGIWTVINAEDDPIEITMELPYVKGVLNGTLKKFIIKKDSTKILIEEGTVLNNMKDDVWTSFYSNGNLRKKQYFKEGKTVNGLELYYEDGSLMNKLDNYYSKNGENSFYYPNGQIESNVVYEEYNPVIEKSSFFNKDGSEKQGMLSYKIEERNGLPYKINIDPNSKEYQNGAIFKYKEDHSNKILYYISQNKGKLNGFKKYRDSKQKDRVRKTYREVSSYYGYLIFDEYEEDVLIRRIVLDSKKDFYKTYELNNDKYLLKQYDGVYGIQNINQEFSLNDKKELVPDGSFNEFYEYGNVLHYSKEFTKGKKTGEWMEYFDDGRKYKKTIYNNDQLVETIFFRYISDRFVRTDTIR